MFLHLLRHWSIYSFMSARIPQKGALLQNGENIRSTTMEPHKDGSPTSNGMQPGSPRGCYLP
jgi:hypothetical protein